MSSFTFPKKVYLSGADCFYLVIEAKAQKHRAGNNVIRIVFQFHDDLKAKELIKNAQQSPLIHWLCNITLHKGSVFYKPYWNYVNTGNKLKVTEHFAETDHFIPEELLNRDIPIKNSCLLEFDIINYESKKNTLILSWNHILMDGRGSGMLVRHLNNPSQIDDKLFSRFFPSAEKKTNLFSAIKNMYAVKSFIENSSRAPISFIKSESVKTTTRFKIKVISFSEEETKTIQENAAINGSKLGSNVFLMACCAQAVHGLNQNKNNAGPIWIPVPYDGRKRGSVGPIITNCISFLFYRVSKNDLITLKETVKSINAQMAHQLKIEMPKKYNMLLNMMRHIPINLYSFLTTRSSKGVVASFLYSSAGEDFRDMTSLLHDATAEITIIPPFTYPPGLTFSFLRQNNALKMTLVYCENTLSTKDLSLLETHIQKNLLQNYP